MSGSIAQQPHIHVQYSIIQYSTAQYGVRVHRTRLSAECSYEHVRVHLLCTADRAAEGRRSLDQEGLHRFLASEADRSRASSTSVSATAAAAIRGGAHDAAQPLARLLQRSLFDYFVRSPLIPRSVAGFQLIDSTSPASLI